jgi:small subunit ribosomal protein S20
MPHTRGAKKRLRQNAKRREANRASKKAIKTQLKRFEAAADGPVDQLRKEFVIAVKKLDKAAAKRVVHPNLAARKKSQMARLIHAKETAPKQ